MNAFLRAILLLALAGTVSSQAFAQQWRGREGGPPPHRGGPMYRYGPPPAPPGMSPEQRERLRQDMNSAGRGYYQGPPPGYDPRRAPPPRTMAPEERERLRRDIQDYHRGFERRR
jgi:hypothetical protein